MKLCHIPGVGVMVDGEEHHVAAEKAGEFFVKEVEPKLQRKKPRTTRTEKTIGT
jgi:hypothetical protein